MKQYQYNGKYYDFHEYSNLIHEKTGIKIQLLRRRIRKGWAIEKLMLPNTVKRPICQYDIEGKFIKKYDSLAEAVRMIRKTSTSAIRKSIKRKIKNGNDYCSGGFIWRYASDVILYKNIKISRIIPYNATKERFYLRDKYDTIFDFCYKPDGKYYKNEKIRMWDKWFNNFEKFYNDLLPLYKEAELKYKNYKRRMKKGVKFKNLPDKLKVNHIWFTRIDKTDGYAPHNICFITPDWTMRFKPNSHRVVVDGNIKFIPEIYDNLKRKQKAEISEAMIRSNVISNNKLFHTIEKHYLYKGKRYDRLEISKMLNISKNRLTNYLMRYGDNAINKALEIKDPSKINYLDKQYRIYELRDKIVKENKTDLCAEVIISRISSLFKRKKTFTKEDIVNIINKPIQKTIYINYKNKKIKLIDFCNENNLDYRLAWKRVKRGWDVDKLFIPKYETKKINYKGKSYTVKEIAKKTNMTPGTIEYRIKQGWDVDKIFTTNIHIN